MDSKTIIGIALVAIIVVAGISTVLTMGDDEVDGITYHGNGGTYDGEESYVFNDTKVAHNLFSNGSFQFLEWNTSADGTGTSYQPNDVAEYNIDLYAIWKERYGSDSYSYAYLGDPKVRLNGDLLTIFPPELKRSNTITFDGYQNLSYDDSTSTDTIKVFTGLNNSIERQFTVEIVGATSITCNVIDGTATVTFTLDSDLDKLYIVA